MTNVWSMMRPNGVAESAAPQTVVVQSSGINPIPDNDTSGRLSQKESEKRINSPTGPTMNDNSGQVDPIEEPQQKLNGNSGNFCNSYNASPTPEPVSSAPLSNNDFLNYKPSSPPKKDAGSSDDNSVILFCAGLPNDLNRDGLKNLFVEKIGEVQSVRIFDNKKDPSRGKFAHVKVATFRLAELAIRELNRSTLGGQSILVKVDQTKNDHPRSPKDNKKDLPIETIKQQMDKKHEEAVEGISKALNGQTMNGSGQMGNNPYTSYMNNKSQNLLINGSQNNGSSNTSSTTCSSPNCSKPPALPCKVCDSVSYCSLTCQIEDWPNHHIACIESLNQGVVAKSSNLNGHSKGSFKSKVEIKPAIPASSLIKLGPITKLTDNDYKVLDGFIVNVDAETFWIRLVANSDEFANFHQEIQNKFNALPKDHNLNYVPKINDLVLAPFMEEQHRAVVISTQQNKCGVLFIDYGNTEQIDVDKVFQMPDDLVLKTQFILFGSQNLIAKHKLPQLELYSKLSFFDPVIFGSSIISARMIKIEQS